MSAKLSELKLPKVRKVIQFEVDGVKKNITVFNVIEQYRKAIEKKLNGDSFGTSSNQNKM